MQWEGKDQKNAPAHQSVLVMYILAKNNVTTLQHPPHSPDQDPADCYLFPRLKSALKWWRFCDGTDISKNATEKLKRLSQNGFQEWFRHFNRRWQTCMVVKGEYILVNNLNDCTGFFYFSEMKWFWEYFEGIVYVFSSDLWIKRNYVPIQLQLTGFVAETESVYCEGGA
jgi:hypothetical protein